ncbi:glycosyltransferase family 87 protein [Olleya sp. Bg11-27]|uniref:glycosyltransferase family 87 protein n=1 Tax=Olleya sp. Bg11-27 TaxID=2058135 RepID=UPI000C3054FE|nr:glycosyltransferase family 87 protein [Olleya sp. Bg11-27]AUC77157.1 hypothetical protein CW732_16330 [Olleya sp. Bg11-27]
MKKWIGKTYYFLPLLVFCAYYTLKAIAFPIHDFANYYFGGYFLTTGHFNANIYFPHLFNIKISDLGYTNIFVSYAPNTPFLALLFSPLSTFQLSTAKLLFNIVSTLLLIVSVSKLKTYYNLKKYTVLFLPLLFYIPFKNNLLFGQVYFLVFYLITEFWIAYNKNKLTKAAIFLSIAILFKVSPIFFIFIFIYKKQFKPILICAISCIALLLFTILFTGIDVWVFWLMEVFSRASNGEIAGLFVDNYQSFYMFLKRLFIFDLLENTSPLFNAPILFKTILITVKAACFLVGFYFTKKHNNNLLSLIYWVLVSLFLSPYGSTYSLIVLIFVSIYVIQLKVNINYRLAFLVLLFVINNLPTHYFLNYEFPFSYLRFLFFIAFIILFFFTTNYKIGKNKIIVLAPVLAIISILFLNEEKENKTITMVENCPILMYDYTLKNNTLEYTYWNQNGEKKEAFPYDFTITKNLKLLDNQIYYNKKQITFSNTNKLNPVLIDDEKIIFLSDEQRGIGFYTLKEINIK